MVVGEIHFVGLSVEDFNISLAICLIAWYICDLQLLERYGVTITNYQTGQHKANTKRAVVEMARHWQTYFSRIFPLSVSTMKISKWSVIFYSFSWQNALNFWYFRTIMRSTSDQIPFLRTFKCSLWPKMFEYYHFTTYLYGRTKRFTSFKFPCLLLGWTSIPRRSGGRSQSYGAKGGLPGPQLPQSYPQR